MPQNAAHWHLVLNHLPVVGVFAGVLLMVALYVFDLEDLKTVSLWWFVAVALVGVPVYLTGEPAEELVEGMPSVSHDALEEHESVALWSFTLLCITGAWAVFGLIYRKLDESASAWILPVLFVAALVTSGMMGYTANVGGKIHHPETRPGFTPPEEEEKHENHEAEGQKESSLRPGGEEYGSQQFVSFRE